MEKEDKFQEYLIELERSIREKYSNKNEITESQVDEISNIVDDLEKKIINFKIEE
jgi:hypothetical protein